MLLFSKKKPESFIVFANNIKISSKYFIEKDLYIFLIYDL